MIDIEAAKRQFEEIKGWTQEQWSRYSDKQVQAILRELEEWDRFVGKWGKLIFFKPHVRQQLFLSPPNREKLPRIRAYIAGNRCLGANTVIDGIEKRIEDLYREGNPFYVTAYDAKNGSLERILVPPPFIKGHGTIYRVTLCDGSQVETSADHRFLVSSDGSYRALRELRPLSALYRPQSSVDTCRSTRVSDAPRWLRTVQGSRYGCRTCSCSYGGLLRMGEDGDPGAAPSQGCVQGRNSAFSCEGGQSCTQGRTHRRLSDDLLSIQDDILRLSGLGAETLSRVADNTARCTSWSILSSELLRDVSYLDPRSCGELVRGRLCGICDLHTNGTCRSSFKMVIDVVPLRKDTIYDLTVQGLGNYMAGGVIHHNSGKSHVGCLEAISFAHGERFWDGTKLPVAVPNRGRIVCTSYLDGVKKVIEPKLKELIPVELLKGGSWEKGSKVGQQGNIVEVRFANGSWFDLMSTEQDSMKHEGADIHWLWCDEPLPRDHWIANTRGLVDHGGFAWLTLTPLTEPWIKSEIYDKATIEPEMYYVAEGATYDNVGFGLTLANVEFFKSTLGADEIAARIEGKFLVLQGMVYKEYRDQYYPNGHLVKPFEIPENWPRFVGIDPHDRTPTHILWCAVDENDDVFVYDELAIGQKTVKEIAEAIKDQEFKQEQPGLRTLRIIDPASVRVSNVAELGMNIGEEFKRHGIYCYPGNNDVTAGHKRVREYLRFRDTLRGPRPRLFIFDSCREFRRAILNYVYDDRNLKGAARDYRDPKENRVREKDKHYPDCYDGKTEVLTCHGWQRFDKLDKGAAVATLSVDGDLEFQKPTEYFEHEHDGEMVNINSRGVDLLVTPNHRMLVYPQSKKLTYRLAKDLKPQDRIPVHSNGCFQKDVLSRVQIGEHSIDIDTWCEFLGWYLAEGCATGTKGGKIQTPGRGYSIYISQKRGWKAEKIAEVLNSMPFKYAYRGNSFVISSKDLWSILWPLGHSGQKHIPREILEHAPLHALSKLWDAYILGDGWEHKGIKYGATISKQLADDMSELHARCGNATTVTCRLPSDSVIRGRKIKAKHVQFYVSPKVSNVAAISDSKRVKAYETIKWNGKVYCVSVPNKTLLVRRNGKTVFCGNCMRYVLMWGGGPIFLREREGRGREYQASNSVTGY